MNTKTKKIIHRFIFLYIPLIATITFIIFPIYWTLITAFKLESDIVSRPVSYFPRSFTFNNFIVAWNSVGFDKYFLNSVIVSGTVLVGVVILSILVAYPLTRFKFKGRKAFFIILLCTQFLPMAMMIIPLFMIFKSMYLIDSLASVIIATIAFKLPFISLLMVGFMSKIPVEIEEAAMIDGCNRLQGLFRIILPILLPGVVAASSFAFIYAWKEFLFTFMFVNSPSKLTITVGLSSMLSEYSISYGLLAAGCIIAMIPPILLFAYIQKFLVQGMASGAIKG
ncbi:carbohydrate ABC transporter permease [Paenibacillus sp. LHD-38]|uniref:carbohydrate ABC transporter permease n=1 Tax=Paenibacillus sp. LHD-38 TaxID=3072143 RepID=UPI00281020D5|nr:carbohydrate ABC transporter permease [Paenibacillus sp. LHD-38]MDQ8736201.1 carbohydrate ABC transporter permease [Paenibacillus sp. LHD-38]